MKFSKEQLKGAMLGDFKFGRDLTVAYQGSQLVETKREGGVFCQMDHNGAPVLRREFVEYLDDNDTGVIATYQQALEAWEAMREQEPECHAVLHWLIFERSAEKNVEWLAERLGVSERTIRNHTDRGLRFMANAFRVGVSRIVWLTPPAILAA